MLLKKYHIKEKMMSIPDRNETIYQVIYSSLTHFSDLKVLKEFGFYNYFIIPEMKGEVFECK